MKKTEKKKPMKVHWYRIHVGECCVCGRDKGFRERVEGERPNKDSERYVRLPDSETYDHCLEMG